MTKQILAIALCRVSSLEQLQNNSLRHQKDVVLRTAEGLGAVIPTDGVWAGQVSSKVGLNFDRKDLKEMFEYCKTHPNVRYLIVSEVDRFMRSPDEQTYWYVKFWYEVKVKIWFADKPELNADTHEASLFRYLEGWRAGGSNVERINKSINGQTAALNEGRYPFAPKPGYKKGSKPGIQEIHDVRGPILKETLIKIVNRRATPTQALIDFNETDFTNDHSPYKMDKFRKIVTDPFYAGIVEIHKQVDVRNENGLHEPLISKQQHYELIKIMDAKEKVQSGPRKNGNPKYPLDNIVACDLCLNKRNGRVVGFDHGNGKPNSKIYERYRCRGCGRLTTRQILHKEVQNMFEGYEVDDESLKDLLKALKTVWKQRENQSEQELNRIRHNIKDLQQTIDQQVEGVTDPRNSLIKDEILASIAKKKDKVVELENSIESLQRETDKNEDEFLQFAFKFIDDMGNNFLELSQENRSRCKQIVFPGGIYWNKNNKVYTQEVSPLYRLAAKKKGAKAPNNSLLVRVKRL